MKEELTTAMHGEFTVSEATEKKHTAWAVFSFVAAGIPLANALYGMDITAAELPPYLPEWSASSGKQIILE